jgi:hypothetical protein
LRLEQDRPEHDRRPVPVTLDAVRECAATGRSSSTKTIEDATALWVALHGYVSLRAAIPDYPWPPDDIVLDNLIDRVALLSEESTGAEVTLRAGDRLAHHDWPLGVGGETRRADCLVGHSARHA